MTSGKKTPAAGSWISKVYSTTKYLLELKNDVKPGAQFNDYLNDAVAASARMSVDRNKPEYSKIDERLCLRGAARTGSDDFMQAWKAEACRTRDPSSELGADVTSATSNNAPATKPTSNPIRHPRNAHSLDLPRTTARRSSTPSLTIPTTLHKPQSRNGPRSDERHMEQLLQEARCSASRRNSCQYDLLLAEARLQHLGLPEGANSGQYSLVPAEAYPSNPGTDGEWLPLWHHEAGLVPACQGQAPAASSDNDSYDCSTPTEGATQLLSTPCARHPSSHPSSTFTDHQDSPRHQQPPRPHAAYRSSALYQPHQPALTCQTNTRTSTSIHDANHRNAATPDPTHDPHTLLTHNHGLPHLSSHSHRPDTLFLPTHTHKPIRSTTPSPHKPPRIATPMFSPTTQAPTSPTTYPFPPASSPHTINSLTRHHALSPTRHSPNDLLHPPPPPFYRIQPPAIHPSNSAPASPSASPSAPHAAAAAAKMHRFSSIGPASASTTTIAAARSHLTGAPITQQPPAAAAATTIHSGSSSMVAALHAHDDSSCQGGQLSTPPAVAGQQSHMPPADGPLTPADSAIHPHSKPTNPAPGTQTSQLSSSAMVATTGLVGDSLISAPAVGSQRGAPVATSAAKAGGRRLSACGGSTGTTNSSNSSCLWKMSALAPGTQLRRSCVAAHLVAQYGSGGAAAAVLLDSEGEGHAVVEEECRWLRRAAREVDGVVGNMPNWRNSSSVQKALKLVRDEALAVLEPGEELLQ